MDEDDKDELMDLARELKMMEKHPEMFDPVKVKTVYAETDATDDPLCPFIAWPEDEEGPICMGFNREQAARRLGKALGAEQVVWVHGGFKHTTIVL